MDKIEKKILDIIDAKQDEIIAFGKDIFYHAEIGYKEFRTAEKFNTALKDMGLEVDEGLSITGAKGYLKGKDTDGVTLALMGELDALPITNAEHSNAETGAAHCCGHNAQLTGVLGAAMALTDPEVKDAIDGNVVFFSVPAEEYVDIEYRNGLREEGKARYGGGKCDLIRVGALDDVDAVVGHHSVPGDQVGLGNGSSNGFVSKTVKFVGKSSHAAGMPHLGIDALAASNVAQHAIAMQRESFQDKDTVRVHGIVSRGGEAVNVIADNVTMEFLVRAKNIPAIKDASYKVDRALKSGAIATGCGVEIETMPGYLPTIPAEDTAIVSGVIDDIMAEYDGKFTRLDVTEHGTGSTDYGDISYVKPLIQFNTGGFGGIFHHPSFSVQDDYMAYVLTAKIFAITAYRMMKDGAAGAKQWIEGFTPTLSKEGYLEYMESMLTKEETPITPVPAFE